jgi:hypothetical protein
LARLWFGWSGILFCIVLAQSLFGRFGSRVADAWSWFVPLLFPTLSLIAGALVADSKKSGRRDRQIGAFIRLLAVRLSVAFLVTMSLTILLGPVGEYYGRLTPIDFLRISQLWLIPLQGVATAVLGVFFLKSEAP